MAGHKPRQLMGMEESKMAPVQIQVRLRQSCTLTGKPSNIRSRTPNPNPTQLKVMGLWLYSMADLKETGNSQTNKERRAAYLQIALPLWLIAFD
jgi:hypothetical protein